MKLTTGYIGCKKSDVDSIIYRAKCLINKPNNEKTVNFPNGNTNDIMRTIIEMDNNNDLMLNQNFAKLFKGDLKYKVSLVWYFVKNQIAYKIDPFGYQFVKSPQKTYFDKFADCKSYSIFAASIFKSLGIPYSYRFVSFSDSKIPTHVYLVVHGNSDYVLDACLNEPFIEKPYKHKIDYMPEIISLSGISGKRRNPRKKRKGIEVLKKIHKFATMPLMAPAKLTAAAIRKVGKVKKGSKFDKVLRFSEQTPFENAADFVASRKKFKIGSIDTMSEGKLSVAIAKHRAELEQDIVAGMRGIGCIKCQHYQNRIEVLADAFLELDRGQPEMIGYVIEDVERGVYNISAHTEQIGSISGKRSKVKQSREDRDKSRANRKAKRRKAFAKLKTAGTKFLKKVGETAKKGLKAFAKFATLPMRMTAKAVLEVLLPKSSPFFLYLFITDPKVISKLPAKVARKRKKAERLKNFIVKVIGMKESHFMGIVRNGIMKKFGKSPESLLSNMVKISGSGSGIGIAPLIMAAGPIIDTVMKLLGQLMKVFKKKPEGEGDDKVNESDMPNPSDFETSELSPNEANQLANEIKNQPSGFMQEPGETIRENNGSMQQNTENYFPDLKNETNTNPDDLSPDTTDDEIDKTGGRANGKTSKGWS